VTKYPEIFAHLYAPFAPHEVKVRTQAGRNLSYITARTAMNRLDDVLGPENWSDEYIPMGNALMCRITITLPDGSTIAKADGGAHAGMNESDSDEKSAFSDAFKRTAVKFGVGRYLYRDGVPGFAEELHQGGVMDAVANTPPPRRESYQDRSPRGGGNGGGGNREFTSPPRSGRALFAWVKDQEQQHDVSLLGYLQKWGKLQDFPGRMVDWEGEQVAAAHTEALKKLGGGGNDEHDGPDEFAASHEGY
jgi:hypothetical protein